MNWQRFCLRLGSKTPLVTPAGPRASLCSFLGSPYRRHLASRARKVKCNRIPGNDKVGGRFLLPLTHPPHTQLRIQVPGRLPARSFSRDSLVNPRSVHQHCLSKDYPCTSVPRRMSAPAETSHSPSPRNFVQQETAKKRHRKPRSQSVSTIG